MDRRIKNLIDKGYDIDVINKLTTYTQSEISNAIKILIDEAEENSKTSDSPHIYFIGGQPGSGKSSAMKRVAEIESELGIVNIEMDSYRMMNPKISEIKQAIFDLHDSSDIENKAESMSRDLVAFTQKYADLVADNLTIELFKQGYNLCIESTLRNPNSKIELASKMRQANNKCVVSVIMMGISRELAMEGTVTRAKQMDTCIDQLTKDAKEKGITLKIISRGGVDQEFYNKVCDDLPNSIEVFSLMKNKNIINGNVQIQDRLGNIYFDRNKEYIQNKAKEIEFDSLNGLIAKKQIEESKKAKNSIYGIESFINENKSIVKDTYGSLKFAKQIFKDELLKQNSIEQEKELNSCGKKF